jgi:anti-anti-sigma factor
MHASFVLPRHRRHSHNLRFNSSRLAPSIVAVDVHGEVDASNADQLIRYVTRVRMARDVVVLDLSGVTFIGTHGFSAILQAKEGGTVVVPSPVVDRLLRLCDPQSLVPVAADVDAAVTMLRRRPHPASQFVKDLRARF